MSNDLRFAFTLQYPNSDDTPISIVRCDVGLEVFSFVPFIARVDAHSLCRLVVPIAVLASAVGRVRGKAYRAAWVFPEAL